jgi:hypothetical protein
MERIYRCKTPAIMARRAVTAAAVGCHYVDNFVGDFPDGHWGRWDGEYRY